jgi:hypothetical protein
VRRARFLLDGTSAAMPLGSWFNLQQFTLSLWLKAASASR